MAKFIYNELAIPDLGDTKFTVPLHAPITMIVGDSATGKSYMYDTALFFIAQLPHVALANQTQPSVADLRENIATYRNRLFIIDNVDLLLTETSDLDLLHKSRNQFILLGRNTQFFGIPDRDRAYFTRKGLHYTLNYFWGEPWQST